MQSRVTVQKADPAPASDNEDEEAERYRLTNLEVREVSLVDRGANKHKFLIVKRAEDPMKTKTQKDATAAAAAADPTTAAAADGAEAPTTKLQMAPGTKAALQEKLAACSSRMKALEEQLATAEEVDGAPDMPTEVASELQAIAMALYEHKAATPPAADPPAAPTEPTETTTEKAGAKMSQARLQLLRTVHDNLAALLAEVAPTEPAGDAAATPAVPAASVEQAAELAKARETIAGLTAQLAKAEATNVECLGKIEKLTEVVMRQQSDIAKAGGSTKDSRALPVDKSADARASWPRDMNDRPAS